MFNKINDIALGVLNNVIWKLYEKGYHCGGKLIEDLRDREALQMIQSKEDARKIRFKRYEKVGAVYKTGKRFHDTAWIIKEIKDLKMLDRVYFCLVTNVAKLRTFKTSTDLYNAAAYSYLYTFEAWYDGKPMAKADLYKFRTTLDTVGRCIRHIKEDHPEFFNDDLIKTAGGEEFDAVDSFGNSVV